MLARELASLGHDVTFLTSQSVNIFSFPFKKEIRDNVKMISFPDIVPAFMRRTGFGFLSVIFKTIYVFSHDFDIYHADAGHRPSGGLPILSKKMFKKIIYVAEWWDYFGRGGQFDSKKGFKKYSHGYYDLLFEVIEKRIADGVICLSTGMLERAISLYISKKKLTVITGGSDTRSITYYPTTDLKSKYGIDNPSLTFGFIGMNKGEFYDIIPFIKAVKLLIREGFNINWFTTGKYISETTKKEYNIGPELFEFGWVDYKAYPEILSCADIFILLQRENLKSHTRWPNKIGDYLAAGRPILTNPYGEIVNLVEKRSDFFLIVNYEVNSNMNTIKRYLKDNTWLATHDNIRAYAEKEFSWKKRGEQLIKFYESFRNER